MKGMLEHCKDFVGHCMTIFYSIVEIYCFAIAVIYDVVLYMYHYNVFKNHILSERYYINTDKNDILIIL